MGRIFSFVSNCGGSGKTTLITHIAYELAILGHSVIIIDLDAQHGIDATLGLDPVEYNDSFVAYIEQWINDDISQKYVYHQPLDVKTKKPLKGVMVGQGNIGMGALSFDVQASLDRKSKEEKIGACLRSVAEDADFVLVDLPGSMMSFSLAETVLLSSDYILIPEIPESRSLDVLFDLFKWLDMCGLTHKAIGIIPNRVTTLKGHTKILDAIRDSAAKLNIAVYPIVRESGYVINAAVAGRVLGKQRPSSPVRSAIKEIAQLMVEAK